MKTSELDQADKNEISNIHALCTKDPAVSCEMELKKHAKKERSSSMVNEYLENLKSYFCSQYPGVDFCPKAVSSVAPVVVQPAPPQLTPEQIQQQQIYEQQQQQMLRQQQIISELTTPSGFIGQNPGISIGCAVILLTGLCFFAAFACSFLVSNTQKPSVPQKKKRRMNQGKNPSKNRNQQKSSPGSKMSKMERGKKTVDKMEGNEEKEEKPKSSYSKSKKNTKDSVDSTS